MSNAEIVKKIEAAKAAAGFNDQIKVIEALNEVLEHLRREERVVDAREDSMSYDRSFLAGQ